MKTFIDFFKQKINIISVEEELIWIHIINMCGCMYMNIYTLPLKRFESSLMLTKTTFIWSKLNQNSRNYNTVKYCNKNIIYTGLRKKSKYYITVSA